MTNAGAYGASNRQYTCGTTSSQFVLDCPGDTLVTSFGYTTTLQYLLQIRENETVILQAEVSGWRIVVAGHLVVDPNSQVKLQESISIDDGGHLKLSGMFLSELLL